MKLDRIVREKEEAYIYMERYVNNGSPSGFDRKNTSSKATAPRSKSPNYDLLVVRFDDRIEVKTIGEKVDILGERCLFCHPDNLNSDILRETEGYYDIVDRVRVAPTASARTVKLLGSNYFIKLDYIGYLGRIRRNLDYQHLLSAYEVTKEICDGIDSGIYNEKFGILKEDKGRVAYLPKKDGGFYEFGCLVREATTYHRQNEKDLFLIPAFSLFANDLYVPTYKPLLLQLYECSGKDINDFAFNDLLGPMIDCYFDALVHNGFGMEAHAQNTLIAIDGNYQIRLIVSRDMESVDKDLPLREFLGVKNEISSLDYKCIREEDYNYIIKHSFMFDFKFGEYLLSPIIELLSHVDGFKRQEIIEKMKAKSQSYISLLPKGYFPKVWYNYENRQFKEGEKRPYISNLNPKYR
mgnify:CR=1 FL=1